jgi:hypothetical protein
MEGRLRVAAATAPWWSVERARLAIILLATAAISAIVIAKVGLAWRININWDEFLFLSRIHELVRGELGLLLQGAYTHAFRWLADDGDEVRQVVEARVVMAALLGASAWLLYRVARAWASPPAAAAAVLAFLGAWPVLKHGASFRADSLLLPLILASLAALVRSSAPARRSVVLAGLCFGVACVVTIKAVLTLPVLLLAASLPDAPLQRDAAPSSGRAAGRIALFLLTAAVAAGVLLAAHATQVVTVAEPAIAGALRAADTTLLALPFAPRGDLFLELARSDSPFWIAAGAGLFIAVRRRELAAAAASLAILPVLVYRNAFPYYYPVMMAPLAVLVALAFERLLHWPAGNERRGAGSFALLAVCAVMTFRAWDGLMALRFDGQERQRAVVAAVHRVFPHPVPYVDHSGMIASFPKANFFMSSWGVEAYLRRGQDFMPSILAGACPPLLLANHPVLVDGTLLNRQLRAEDRRLLASGYVDYWGPIRVAGAAIDLAPGTTASVSVPCSGRYRVESGSDIIVDGIARRGDDVLELDATRNITVGATAHATQRLRLVWAGAREPPSGASPELPLYDPL